MVTRSDLVFLAAAAGQAAARQCAALMNPDTYDAARWASFGDVLPFRGDDSGEAAVKALADYVCRYHAPVHGEQLYRKAHELGVHHSNPDGWAALGRGDSLPYGLFATTARAVFEAWPKEAIEADAEPVTETPKPRFSEEQIVAAAAYAHEQNRLWCLELGDTSQMPWADAPEWQRTSCISGVRFLVSNDFPPPEASHENWLRDKAADGWTFGEVKDAEKKTHPCFRPYAELPHIQQYKDHLFRWAVRFSLAVATETRPFPPPVPPVKEDAGGAVDDTPAAAEPAAEEGATEPSAAGKATRLRRK